MTRIIEVLQTILPVMIMLCIGMICRSRQLISREGINALKSVAVNIALPAVLLSAFATTSYTFMDVIIPLMMFMVCVAAWALGKAGAKLLGMSSRFVPFLTTGFEAGMLGYALFNMLYGSSRTADFARIDLGQVLFVFTLYKILLGLEGEEKAEVGQLLKEMAFRRSSSRSRQACSSARPGSTRHWPPPGSVGSLTPARTSYPRRPERSSC